jgi:hypothetical protein
MEFVLPAVAVACGAFFIWFVVGIVNRRIPLAPQAILRKKQSLVAVICACSLLAGSIVNRQYPILAFGVLLVGLALAVTVVRLGR